MSENQQRMWATIIMFACFFIGSQTGVCRADGDARFVETVDDASDAVQQKNVSFFDRLVFAPVPMVNPTLGAGLTGVVMYMHPEDDFWNDPGNEANEELHSMTGVAAMATSNESWAAGMFHKGFYANDRFRGTAYLAYGEFNLKYYGVGNDSALRNNPLKYSADVTAFQGTFSARIFDHWYLGPKIKVFNWDFGVDFSSLHPVLPTLHHSVKTVGLGLAGERDTTNDSVFATAGGKLQFDFMSYNEAWGGDYDYSKASTSYAHYYGLTDRLVVSGMAELNFSDGNTPFFDMPFLRLRGFPYAEYIDKQSASIQTEIKYKLTQRWGVNLFGGLGWVADEPNQLFKNSTIPTGGFGVRYLLSEKETMYLSTEIGFGPNSQAVYFRVGEWF
ncbi:BamA/TamA family outer membrane protein [Pseudodesulfovibrio sp. JC047]|uniref:BamA/TamA family outer membrane protein n=1 Tax=Pseudodesulfovibrio sp. JC047 TaxID=2683199 RepID=UPI0013CF637C|nr:BamA/TamA family outer membrane protein [Pseudodesulfovibrio sp. JC047]NDV20658.1 BamA/TamA family outer membrane protein [Pseudodesulfovibrio sp. JC047]